MRSVAAATKASVDPASNQVAPIAGAREAGTQTWSLHETYAKPARSAVRAAWRSSGPPIALSQACARAGICWTAGRLVPNLRPIVGIGAGCYTKRACPRHTPHASRPGTRLRRDESIGSMFGRDA